MSSLVNNKFYFETTKRKIDMNFAMAHILPEFYKDPASKEMMDIMDVLHILPLPKYAPNRTRVFLYAVRDPTKVLNAAAAISMIRQLGMIMAEWDLSCNKIIVSDGANFKLSNSTQFTPMLFRKSSNFFQVSIYNTILV